MQADLNQLETLFDVQKLGLAVAKAQKQLAELPQRQAILNIRTKRAEVQAKQEQVAALVKDSQQQLVRLRENDEKLADKQAWAQTAIEENAGNFREVTARSKELDSLDKQRTELAGKIDIAQQRAAKAQALAAQVQTALATLDANEQAQIASFKEEGTALQKAIALAQAERKKLVEGIAPELLEAYLQAEDRGAGVGLGRFQDGRCGVCRTKIDPGRVQSMRAEAPLSTCPSCRRLLVM